MDEKPLAEELSFFQAHRADWVEIYEGQFAVVKGQDLVGTYSTFQQAYEEGVAQFGTEPFLIQQVLREEPTALSPALVLGLIHAGPQLRIS